MAGTLVWCVGIFDSLDAKFTQFFLEPESNEYSLLTESMHLLQERPSSRIISFSASDFEKRILRKRLDAYNLNADATRRIVDIHPILRVRLKEMSFGGLKVVAAGYGYNFTYENMDGVHAASMYSKYLRSKKQSMRERIKKILLRYNSDDVMSLVYLSMCVPEAVEGREFVLGIDDVEKDLLRRFYRSSSLIQRSREGSVELRFRCSNDDDSRLLSGILEKHGFNPRFDFDKNTYLIRMYGYTQVSDFLSTLGFDSDQILMGRSQ